MTSLISRPSSRPSSRARLAVSAAVTAGLCLAGTAALATPSQAAQGTCDTAYPVADLTAGQSVTGLTVSTGTTPTGFTGSILGVVTDGVEPGVDLVMASLTSSEIDAHGIWEGMSGSPVYDQSTGELIGAVSYTLSYGQTSIAGITPWQDMQQYAGSAAPQRLTIPASAARAIARRTSVGSAEAAQGFRELATPHVVTGVSQRTIDRARTRPYLRKDVAAAGYAPADASYADMVAGGNLVATLSTGDVTIGGLGTITSVCNDRVVGFGHPLNFAGRTTYGLAGASALFVQSDPLGPSFKVANIGGLLGTIDQDRMTGISGQLHQLPASIPITSTVSYDDGTATHSRTGETDVQLPDAAAQAAYFELTSNHQAVMDAFAGGGEQQTWSITGQAHGTPFTLSAGNVYADRNDISDAASYDVPDLLYALTRLKSVRVDSVSVQSAVTDASSRRKIVGVEQRRGGTWFAVDRAHPAIVTAGRTAALRLVLRGGSTDPFALAVPARAGGLQADLEIEGGFPFPFERGHLGTFAKISKAVQGLTRNDQARVTFTAFGPTHVVRAQTTTAPYGTVLTGSRMVPVQVR